MPCAEGVAGLSFRRLGSVQPDAIVYYTRFQLGKSA